MKDPSTHSDPAEPVETLARHWQVATASPRGRDDPEADLGHFRAALAALAEAADAGDSDDLGRALRRIAALSEVWECLRYQPDQEEAAAEVAAFCATAITMLACRQPPSPENTEAPAWWIVRQSDERWPDYLALLDPPGPGTELPDEASYCDAEWIPEQDELPTIDAATLLRLITGSQDRSEDPAPAHTKEHPRPEIEIPPLPARFDLDRELREAFVADATELLERMGNLVVGLRRHDDASGAIHELARCFHTLKGAAGSVGLEALATLVHQVEEQLVAASGRVSEGLNDLLHQVVGHLDEVIGLLRSDAGASSKSSAPIPGAATGTPDEPASVQPAQAHAGTAAETPIRVPAARIDELTDLAGELIVQGRFWLSQAELIRSFAATARAARNRLRANMERLHEMGLSREARRLGSSTDPQPGPHGQLAQFAEQADDLSVLAESSQAAAGSMADRGDTLIRLSHQLWDSFQSLRIVPIRGLFHRLARVLHEAARVEGRQVEAVMLGEETGVDRAIQDKAFEPLLHVVRNAVAHGIESPADRARSGKPPVGRVTLEARREGNTLVIAVQDDGKGLDEVAIAEKARRLGWLAPNEKPSGEPLRAFILQPGFSTRSEANAISGRGVGMDVVAREVSKLRGTIELSSQPGRGTRVSLFLPSQLALEPTLIVRAGEFGFAIPALSVESVQPFQPRGADSRSRSDDGGSTPESAVAALATIQYRDQPIPLIFARDTLGIDRNTSHPWPKLVVVRTGSRLIGLVVDIVVGTEDLVIRPLGALLAGHPLVSGTSLSVNGELISIINPMGLERWLNLRGISEDAAAQAAPVCEQGGAPKAERPRVLVADDSISVRRSLARQLRNLGLEVDEACDGMEALSRLRSSGYRLVVTDLEMPRLDGFALLAEMQRSAPLAEIPVVVASTLAGADTQKRVRELGARALLAKPVGARELAGAVAPLLEAVK
jgi:chemotaxis protein histidine kinase CheA